MLITCPTVFPTTISKSEYISPTPSVTSILFESSASKSCFISANPALSMEVELVTEYASTCIDDKIISSNVTMSSYTTVELVTEYVSTFVDDIMFSSKVMMPSYLIVPSNVVKSSDAYYKYSTIMNFQNTRSSNNSEVYDNTRRTLIIAISLPGFVVIVVLIFLSILCFILRIKGSTKDAMANSSLTKCRY